MLTEFLLKNTRDSGSFLNCSPLKLEACTNRYYDSFRMNNLGANCNFKSELPPKLDFSVWVQRILTNIPKADFQSLNTFLSRKCQQSMHFLRKCALVQF